MFEITREVSEFCSVDPYNSQNEVSGFISRKPNEYYGALLITHINGNKVPDQLIMGTPKMHYPFTTTQTGEHKYLFPVAQDVEVYEKLDGTNILVNSYTDGEDVFYTCKTRLMPFVNAGSKWGNFYAMWNEVTEDYIGHIHNVMDKYQCNLSFELYGARNPHLVLYDVSLAFALLFGVTNTGRIISPALLDCKLPKARLITGIDKATSDLYEANQKQMQSDLRKMDDNTYRGSEGSVWYLRTVNNRTMQYKCKPESIEAIHFSQGKGISRNVILATCWNALENTDVLTVEFIKQLLVEEFDGNKVEANHFLIENCIQTVTNELAFRDKVLSEYKSIGININLDKITVMRAMSEKFEKKQMSKVYSTIVNWG